MPQRTDAIYITLPCDRYTPFSLARKINAIAILESASFAKGKQRYSILMAQKAFDILQDDTGVAFLVEGRRLPFVQIQPLVLAAYTNQKTRQPDILDALKYIANQNDIDTKGVPLPASGIGFLSYEFAARCDTIHFAPQQDPLHIPESHFIAGHIYIVFDHFTEMLHIFALNYQEHQIDLKKAIEDLKIRLSDMDFSYLAPPEAQMPCTMLTLDEASKTEYCKKVEDLKKHIIEGDIIQAVPSRRVQAECANSALEIYRRLRSINPSPYLVYLDFGEYQLVGSSPESLVRVRSGVASIRPIAGTRRRGKDATEDKILEKDLLNDPKEKAEHLMLVDLARNDLGRVCQAGTVEVERFMDVELFSHVMHIVSDVTGTVQQGLDSTCVLRSAFPAGTVSGSPKISAIEILSTLEPTKRRFYAGAVGYLQSNGDLDFCIAIRCALKQGNLWTMQAGGGIVYDSTAQREFQETCEKLGALVSVITGSCNKA